MDLGLSGLATGFDWRALVDKLVAVEQEPQNRLRIEQNTIRQRDNAYSSLTTQLNVLKSRVETLKEATLYQGRSTAVSDASIATASAADGAAPGAYAFQFIQLATASQQVGSSGVGGALSGSPDVSGLVLSNAGFSTAITAGSFTVNGHQVTVATSDTLQDVFDKISTATGGDVGASYDPGTDRITLTGSSEIILGSATDTSNFLSVTRLNNNGSNAISSSAELGAVRLSGAVADSNLATPLSDGGAGAGEFKINGVSISFDTSADSIQTILDRINNSSAGVTARYDATNDRFSLVNKTTGDVGFSLEDVSGNFLAATGLSGGSVQRGRDLIYSVDGGPQQTSRSNTITESGGGPAGLTVTALQEGATATITVGSNTEKVKTAINDFLTEYNKTQSLIDSQTASSTDANGKVTAGILANDGEADAIGSELRATVYAQVSGVLKGLADLGIESNGNNNSLELTDTDALDDALANHIESIQDLFSDESTGVATLLGSYLEKTVGDDGTIPTKQGNLQKEVAAIDSQISDLERIVQSNRQRLIESFTAMETAQANINRQLQYLQNAFK